MLLPQMPCPKTVRYLQVARNHRDGDADSSETRAPGTSASAEYRRRSNALTGYEQHQVSFNFNCAQTPRARVG